MGPVGRLFSRRPVPLLGLDIGMSAIRLVELGRAPAGGWALERLGIEPLAAGWVGEAQVEDFDAVVAAVRRLVARSGTRQRQVALAVPASAVITRRLVLPVGLRDDELESLVRLEAEQHIPFPLDEVSLDFGIGGSAAGTGSEQVEVFVAASRLERVQDRQGIAEAAGLVPVVMDIDALAARRALQRWLGARALAHPGALLAWFDVDAGRMRLRVLQDEVVLHEHEQALDTAAPAQDPGNGATARRLAQALQQFFTSAPHPAVDHVLLSGTLAASPAWAEAVAEVTGFATTRVDPFEGMALAPSVARELLAREAGACLVACGLAMREDSA